MFTMQSTGPIGYPYNIELPQAPAITEVEKLLAEIENYKSLDRMKSQEHDRLHRKVNELTADIKIVQAERDVLLQNNKAYRKEINGLVTELTRSYAIRVPATEETKRLNSIIKNLEEALIKLGSKVSIEKRMDNFCIGLNMLLSQDIFTYDTNLSRERVCKMVCDNAYQQLVKEVYAKDRI